MQPQNNNNAKSVIVSILIGAAVAFFATLFEGLAEFLRSHSTDVISGISTSMVYLARTFKGS